MSELETPQQPRRTLDEGLVTSLLLAVGALLLTIGVLLYSVRVGIIVAGLLVLAAGIVRTVLAGSAASTPESVHDEEVAP